MPEELFVHSRTTTRYFVLGLLLSYLTQLFSVELRDMYGKLFLELSLFGFLYIVAPIAIGYIFVTMGFGKLGEKKNFMRLLGLFWGFYFSIAIQSVRFF